MYKLENKNLGDLCVGELKEELERRGLDKTGVKQFLIDKHKEVEKTENPMKTEKESASEGIPVKMEENDLKTGRENENETDKIPKIQDEKMQGNDPEIGEHPDTIIIILGEDEDDKSKESSKESGAMPTESETLSGSESQESGSSTTSKSESSSSEDTKQPDNNNVLWICNLPKKTWANELKHLLLPYGKVQCAKIVVAARYPSSCCFGHVTMASVEDADNVIKKLNNTEFNGQIIRIDKFDNSRTNVINNPSNDSNSADSGEMLSSTGNCQVVEVQPDSSESEKEKINETEDRDESNPNRSRGFERPSRERRRLPSGERPHYSGARSRAILTFNKIKEERERQRERDRERAIREEHRRRREEEARVREMKETERRQRNEAERLQREREKLRIERERIEQEKTELLKLEKQRMRLEREKQVLEQMEMQRSNLFAGDNRDGSNRSGYYRREETHDSRKRMGNFIDEPTSSCYNDKNMPYPKKYSKVQYDKPSMNRSYPGTSSSHIRYDNKPTTPRAGRMQKSRFDHNDHPPARHNGSKSAGQGFHPQQSRHGRGGRGGSRWNNPSKSSSTNQGGDWRRDPINQNRWSKSDNMQSRSFPGTSSQSTTPGMNSYSQGYDYKSNRKY